MRRALGFLTLVLIAAVLWAWGDNYVREHPQDVPWTPLELSDPLGHFTGKKLAALTDQTALCRQLLSRAGAVYLAVPPRREAETQCGYSNGMQLRGGRVDFQPAGPIAACPVAAAMFVFERQILQPAAIEHFGQPVVRIIHSGTYSCRRLYGRPEGPFSEHASANAFDIAGFVLEDGRTVSVQKDWESASSSRAFLRDIRDGACGLFSTVLSPDYNAAHADHLHLDQAKRGAGGWRLCR